MLLQVLPRDSQEYKTVLNLLVNRKEDTHSKLVQLSKTMTRNRTFGE